MLGLQGLLPATLSDPEIFTLLSAVSCGKVGRAVLGNGEMTKVRGKGRVQKVVQAQPYAGVCQTEQSQGSELDPGPGI